MDAFCDAGCLISRQTGVCNGKPCLVTHALKGNSAAREVLFARLFPMVLRQSVMLTRDRDAAADLAQTALLAAFERLNQLRQPRNTLGWMWQIVQNAHRMSLRRGKFEPSSWVEFDEAAASTPPGILVDPIDRIARRQTTVRILNGVRSLPPSLKTVFERRVLRARTTAETAQDLGISVDAVRTRLRRARAALRTAV